jgi:hypothetical protein
MDQTTWDAAPKATQMKWYKQIYPTGMMTDTSGDAMHKAMMGQTVNLSV